MTQMNASENSRNLLETVEALLGELIELAKDLDTDSDELYRESIDILRLLFQPDAVSIFLSGVNGLQLAILPNSLGFEGLFVREENDSENMVFNEAILVKDELARTTIAFGLVANQQPKGVLVFRSKPNGFMDLQKSVVQKIGTILNQHLAARSKQSQSAKSAEQLKQFSFSCMSTLIHDELAELLSNDIRIVLAAERTQYFEMRGSNCKLKAVSSVSQFENRTSLLQSSKKLATEVGQLGKAVSSVSQGENSALISMLQEYEAQSGFPYVVLFPMFATEDHENGERKRPTGVLLVEFNSTPPITNFVETSNVVVPQMEMALHNASAFSSIPMHRTWLVFCKQWRSIGFRRIWFGLSLLALFLLVSIFWKVDFKVRTYGSLHAANERKIFSPRDAFVQKVLVKHDNLVEEGQLLVVLRSPELQQLLDEVDGEIAKLEDLKSSKSVVLNQTTTGKNVDRYDNIRLAGEIAELNLRIESQTERRKFVLEQIDELSIYAPIKGTIVTWDLERLLNVKPVRWGETLLKIADEQQDWQLRFLAPEKSMGYVLEAADDNQDGINGLGVDYFFSSKPEEKFTTTIEVAGKATENDAKNGLGVRLICNVDPKQQLQRHGAQVTADIDCGKRSIAFVWTHELIDTIRRHIVR